MRFKPVRFATRLSCRAWGIVLVALCLTNVGVIAFGQVADRTADRIADRIASQTADRIADRINDPAAGVYPAYCDVAGRRPAAKIRAVDRIDDAMIAVGDLGRIERSDDRGQTWSTVASPTAAMLIDVRWIDSRRVVAAGNVVDPVTQLRRGVILSSVDGGQTFTRSRASDLAGIDRINLTTRSGRPAAQVVGDWSYHAGTNAMVSGDAGQTWQPDDPVDRREIVDSPEPPVAPVDRAPDADRDRAIPNLTVIADSIDAVPWSDVALAALRQGHRVHIMIVGDHPAPVQTLVCWRQAAVSVGGYDVVAVTPGGLIDWLGSRVASRPRGQTVWCHESVSPTIDAWRASSLIRTVVYASAVADPAATDRHRETLVPSLGLLRSDFAADVFRTVAPMADSAKRFATERGRPLLETLSTDRPTVVATSRYRLQLATARLSHGKTVESLLRKMADYPNGDADGLDRVAEALSGLLMRTTAEDRARLAWSMVRMAMQRDRVSRQTPASTEVTPAVLRAVAATDLPPAIDHWITGQQWLIRHGGERRHAAVAGAAWQQTHATVAPVQSVALSPFQRSTASIPIGVGKPDEVVGPSRTTMGDSVEPSSTAPLLIREFDPGYLLADLLRRTDQAGSPVRVGIDPADARLGPLRKCRSIDWNRLFGASIAEIAVIRRRPLLDGDLVDWPVDDSRGGSPRVCRDDEFLYLAVPDRSPVSSRQPVDRRRDGYAGQCDASEISIDIDGDLQTAYHLTIGDDGSHADRVDRSYRWHPTWYIGRQENRPGAKDRWIEIAVSIADLYDPDRPPRRLYLRHRRLPGVAPETTSRLDPADWTAVCP